MLTKVQREAVFNGVPYILNGFKCTKVVADQYVRDPTLPNITIRYLSDSILARWAGQEIRSGRKHRTDDFDCVEGLIEKATVGITISSEDYAQALDMAADMLMQLYRDRLRLNWYDYRVRFINTLAAPIITSYRYEEDRKLVHRAHIDVSIEYEVSWPIVAPAIRKIGADIGVKDMGEIAYIHELMYAPGLYGMDTILSSDRCILYVDTLIAKKNLPGVYGVGFFLYDPGTVTDAKFEMGLTIF